MVVNNNKINNHNNKRVNLGDNITALNINFKYSINSKLVKLRTKFKYFLGATSNDFVIVLIQLHMNDIINTNSSRIIYLF